MTESRARVRFIEQAIAAQETERARIARELHDGIGQSLTSLLVGLRSLEACVYDPDAKRLATQLRETAASAIGEVRRLAQGLRPTALDDLGLGAAIERLIEDLGGRHQLEMDLQISGLDAEPRLPPSLEITIYRIVQEALNNIAKHANATSACVVLERRGEVVRLIVEDDGEGMGDTECGDGFGLLGIRERLALVKGELTIESSREGTALFVSIPCRPRRPRRFSLSIGDKELPLPPGDYIIGRGAECEIQLDVQRVSRRHAKLSIGEYEAYVEDVGSTNGVFVNGQRADGSYPLRDGDGIVIGDESIHVKSSLRQPLGTAEPEWREERTLPGISERTDGASEARDVTERANMLEIAGTMALSWLAQNRVEEAERVLSGHLRRVLDAVRTQDPVPVAVVRTSVTHALRLAQATKNPGWVRYALELSEMASIFPSDSTAAALEQLRAGGVEVPADALHEYLRSAEHQGPPSDECGYVLERLRRLVAASPNLRRGSQTSET